MDMKRTDLPLNCHRSETGDLPVITCVCGRRLRAITTRTPSLASEPDPTYTVSWDCPDELCHGPFD
jgi:hypothetical protein